MSSSMQPARIYSRKHSMKGSVPSVSPTIGRSSTRVSDDDSERPRKRRTLTKVPATSNEDVEVLLEMAPRRYFPRLKQDIPTTAGHPITPSSPTLEDSAETDVKGKNKAVAGMSSNHLNRSPTTPSEHRGGTPVASDSSCTSLLLTPKKRPKDLSEIFDAVSPQRRARSRRYADIDSPKSTGVTKRMLSRSRTESSLDSSPSRAPRPLTKSQSLTDPSYGGQYARRDTPLTNANDWALTQEMHESPLASGSQQPHRDQINTRRTYAGKSRSFLVALPAASLVTRLDQPGIKKEFVDEGDEEQLRDSYTELRRRWGVDNSENDVHHNANDSDAISTSEGLSLNNPLSSITDLRSLGETRRFLDEMGYLFEGLESTGALSVRRSSAFDVVSKLCDQEFWRKAKAACLLSEIWNKLRGAGAGDGDKILDPILCCFASLASEDPRDVSLLASDSDFIETVIQLMITHIGNDPFVTEGTDDKLRLTTAEKMTLSRLRNTISQNSNVIKENCKPSTRLLLSNVLSAVPSLAYPHLAIVMDALASDLTSVSSRLSAFRAGLPLLPNSESPIVTHEKLCLEHIHNSLKILDLYLIEAENIEESWLLSKLDLLKSYGTLAGGLISLTIVADIVDRSTETDALRSQANRCSELSLRVLINLTNGSPLWSEAIVTEPFALPTLIRLIISSYHTVIRFNAKNIALDTDEAAFSCSMDRLCLTLALLTNLVQEREELAGLLHNISCDPSCEGHRQCLLGCRCVNARNAVSGLVSIYVSLLKGEDDETVPEFHFLRGHLAMLVGLLLLQLQGSESLLMQRAARSLIDDLPGPLDIVPQKLDALIADIDDFSALYATLSSRVSRSASRGCEKEDEGSARNKASSNAVTEVATSLKALRRKQ